MRFETRRAFPSYTLFGAIAQLEERLLCKQQVVGSIPSGSTTFSKFKFRNSNFEVQDPANGRSGA
jgi:hypothetical protein